MNLERLVCGQYPYNLLVREFEHELLPAFEDQGMGFNCWSPLAGGLLTGKYHGSTSLKMGTRIYKRTHVDVPRFWNARTLAVTEEIWRNVEEVSEPEPDAVVKQDLMAIKTTVGEEEF